MTERIVERDGWQQLATAKTSAPETVKQDSKNFLRGEPWLVSEADVQTRWSFQKPGSGAAFRCAWCGHKFKAGDVARCIYTNTATEHKTIRGNPFICASCDGPDAIDRLVAMAERVKQVRRECWWFYRHGEAE